jgi:hypothetical protein
VIVSRYTAAMTPFDAAKPRSKTKSPAMSLEQALFEEEQEVLALIGAKEDTLPPPPPPIGGSRNGSASRSSMLGPSGSLSSLNSKQTRSSSYVGPRRDIESLLSPQSYQMPMAINALNRASEVTGSRRKSAPDHARRSSSPVPRPVGMKSPTSSPPPAVQSFDKAYRRLSNAAMAQSGGSLGRLGTRSPGSSLSQGSIGYRLEKDKDPDSVIESSSSSDSESESSRPTSSTQSPPLRPRNTRGSQDELQYETRRDRIPLSLSAAADQESSFQIRFEADFAGRAVASIVGPFSGPGPRPLSSLNPRKPRRMGRDPNKAKRVFPSTNFDSSRPASTDGASGSDAPGPNREEEARKAARLAIHEGDIVHSPDRTVMIITRGEFLEMEKLGLYQRQRKYLVSSDLSPQATYAMEWTIGTVLREGDILYVTQALGKDDEPCSEKDREFNCRTLAEETIGLLKRTRLQVKIIIEIVAAKIPKHMITEMVCPLNAHLMVD